MISTRSVPFTTVAEKGVKKGIKMNDWFMQFIFKTRLVNIFAEEVKCYESWQWIYILHLDFKPLADAFMKDDCHERNCYISFNS